MSQLRSAFWGVVNTMLAKRLHDDEQIISSGNGYAFTDLAPLPHIEYEIEREMRRFGFNAEHEQIKVYNYGDTIEVEAHGEKAKLEFNPGDGAYWPVISPPAIIG